MLLVTYGDHHYKKNKWPQSYTSRPPLNSLARLGSTGVSGYGGQCGGAGCVHLDFLLIENT